MVMLLLLIMLLLLMLKLLQLPHEEGPGWKRERGDTSKSSTEVLVTKYSLHIHKPNELNWVTRHSDHIHKPDSPPGQGEQIQLKAEKEEEVEKLGIPEVLWVVQAFLLLTICWTSTMQRWVVSIFTISTWDAFQRSGFESRVQRLNRACKVCTKY